MFRGLMFEAEAETFRRAGIQIGALTTEAEESLLREALTPFGVARRNQALEMARLYAVLSCFENEIRDFIRDALQEKEGLDWQEKLPPKVKEYAEGRRDTAVKDSWLFLQRFEDGIKNFDIFCGRQMNLNVIMQTPQQKGFFLRSRGVGVSGGVSSAPLPVNFVISASPFEGFADKSAKGSKEKNVLAIKLVD